MQESSVQLGDGPGEETIERRESTKSRRSQISQIRLQRKSKTGSMASGRFVGPITDYPTVLVDRDGIEMDDLESIAGDQQDLPEEMEMMAEQRQMPASCGPMGLMAFGICTVLKSFMWYGVCTQETYSFIAISGIMYGGFIQVAAGWWELVSGRTFIATANFNFGAFWLGISLFDLLRGTMDIKVDPTTMPWGYFIWSMVWFVHTLGLTLCTRYTIRPLQLMYVNSTSLFLVLGLANFWPIFWQIGGVMGFLLGLNAIYIAYAEIINTVYDRDIIPLWPCPKKVTILD